MRGRRRPRGRPCVRPAGEVRTIVAHARVQLDDALRHVVRGGGGGGSVVGRAGDVELQEALLGSLHSDFNQICSIE